jgi:hypothetical protein
MAPLTTSRTPDVKTARNARNRMKVRMDAPFRSMGLETDT